MRNFISICLDELNEAGELWIDHNYFGRNYKFLKFKVCEELKSKGIEYEIHTFNKQYLIKLFNQ